MQDKRKLNNGAETIAVTSFLSFTYKPIKQVHAFDDYTFPASMCSKKGHLDTSRKFIKIGGGDKMFLTNNHYGQYGKYLKQKHVKMNINRNSSHPCDSQISTSVVNDAKKADNTQKVEFCEPKIKKEFIYRRDKEQQQKQILHEIKDFMRTDDEGLKIIKKKEADKKKLEKLHKLKYADDDDSDDEVGFWNDNIPQKPLIQGFDSKAKQEKVEKQVNKFVKINYTCDPLYTDVAPTAPILNERNQVAAQVRKNLEALQKEIDELLQFQVKMKTTLKNYIQGGTFSSVNKVNDIINTAHHELVEKKTLENTTDVINSMSTLTSALQSIVTAVHSMIDGIRGYIDQVLQTINRISPMASYLLDVLTKSLIIHFASYFISKMCFGIDLSLIDFVGVLYAVLVKYAFYADRSWGETLLTTCLCIFANTWRAATEERVRVESKDLFLLPFSVCLGMGLLASGKHSFCENFIGSIKGFGGVLAFSNKCDSIIRGIADIVPQVFVEYFRAFFPTVYEYMILGWKDQDFQKDLQELIKIIGEPDAIYYSSHNVKKFLDLVARFKDFYIPQYGHFSFFSTSPIFDKVDCIYEEVKRRGLIPGKRHCPYVVWIAGDSGVGKSSLAQYLASQFIDQDIDYAKQVYTWNPVLEFQDGYNHQPVVIINDYMQTTDHGEEQILISIKDACDWMLNSSSTDDTVNGKKGEMRFTSKLILITSNMTYLHSSNYIRETQAFNRRRDMLIEMKFKGSAKFDYLKADYSWCSFAIKDPCLDGLHKRSPIDGVSDLITLIKLGYKKHYDTSLHRVINGLKIQGEEDIFDDAQSPGFLKNIIINRAREVKNNSIDFLHKHYKWILAGISICGMSAFLLAKLLMKLPLIQAFNSGDSNTIAKVHPKVMERFKTQADTEDHDRKQTTLIEKQMYRVSTCILIDNQSMIRSVTGIYLGNDVLLLPKHVFYRGEHQIKPGEMIIINKGNIIYETTFEKQRLTEAGEDYCFYNVHLIMPRQKNIANMFDNGLEPLDKETTCLVMRLDSTGTSVDQTIVQGFFTPSVTCYDEIANSSREYKGNVMIRARANLQFGDCGALIGIRLGGNFRIFGIHVGGLSGVNYFQLTNVRDFVKNQERVIPIRGFVESIDFSHPFGQFLIQGEVHPSAFPFSNNKTKIKPSICYEILQPHSTEPAVLSISDPRNPEKQSMLHNGTIAIGKILKPINSNNFEELLQYMRIKHRCLYGDYRILTLSESINGIDGLDRIDFSTSPGYPYTVLSQGVSFRKTDFFKFDGNTWTTTEAFEHEFNKFLNDCRNNGIPMIWTNCVKDERRPIGKILKSRIFTISNIMLTIVGRQIFGQYVERYSRTRHEHGGMIGINPYSGEWSLLYDKLNVFPYANDGDFSKFDKDLLKEVFQLFSVFAKEIIPNGILYDMPIHKWIDEILYCTLFSDTLTILDGKKTLITSLHGNPSGWFLTVFFNDFANKIYIYSVWQRIFKYQIPAINDRISEFLENVRDVYYGDDNLYTVSSTYKDQFNASTIAHHLLDMYNITYTSGDKSDVVSYNKPLKECTFLKNHFVVKDGIIVAGLDKNTIQEMVSWTRDDDKSLQQILETCLRYSYFWGMDYFNNNRRKLILFSQNLPTYQELDYEFNTNGGLNFELYSKNEEHRYLELLHKINKLKMSKQRENTELKSIDNVIIADNSIKVQSSDMVTGLRDDDNVTSTISHFGVSMVNQNINNTEHLYNKAAKVDIPETTSNLKKLLSRPLLVFNKEISAGTFGTVTSVNFPSDWVRASRNIEDISKAYFLFKGKIKMQATLQSTPFNAGAMVIHTSYKSTSNFINGSLDSLYNAWLRPHTELDYSDNAANKIVDVPWKYKREYVDFASDFVDEVCSVYFTNYLPNTANARLMIYMWVEDADVVVTRPTIQGITLFGDSVTNVSTTQNIQSVAGNVMPANVIGDQFDTEVSPKLSAMDQPNITLESRHTLMKREGTSCNAQQIQQMEKLSLYPREQMMSDFDTFGTNEDEMSIDYLKRKWTPGGMVSPASSTFKYTTSTEPYTVLAAGLVGPYGSNPMFYRKTNDAAVFTFLDYISKNHALWRGANNKDGAMEYRFKFACNRFQSGRIAIVYNPYATWLEMFGTTDDSSMVFSNTQLGACYVAYFDINGQDNEIVVRLPYVAPTPWKSCWSGCAAVDSTTLTPMWRNSFCGVIGVIAITPMVSPEGSPTEINVASFVRGAPGFQVACLCSKNNAIAKTFRVTAGMEKNDTPTVDPRAKALLQPRVQSATKKSKIKVDCWEILRQLIRMPKVEFELPYYRIEEDQQQLIKVQSEDFVFLGDDKPGSIQDNSILPTTSLRDMCKRFSPVLIGGGFSTAFLVSQTGTILTLGLQNQIRIANLLTVPLLPESENNSNGLCMLPSWFAQMGLYQAFRGGMKFRIRVMVDRNSVADLLNPKYVQPRTNNPYHVMVFLDDTYIGSNNLGSVTIGTTAWTALPNILTRDLGRNTVGGVRTQTYYDTGLVAMESNVSGEIDIDVEVPVHLFNKYHELLGIAGEEGSASESRPKLRIFIYSDIMIESNTTSSNLPTIGGIMNDERVKSIISDTQMKFEVFQSFADDARCGILDEYPYLLSGGTDYYINATNSVVAAPRAAVPRIAYNP